MKVTNEVCGRNKYKLFEQWSDVNVKWRNIRVAFLRLQSNLLDHLVNQLPVLNTLLLTPVYKVNWVTSKPFSVSDRQTDRQRPSQGAWYPMSTTTIKTTQLYYYLVKFYSQTIAMFLLFRISNTSNIRHSELILTRQLQQMEEDGQQMWVGKATTQLLLQQLKHWRRTLCVHVTLLC